MKGDISPGDFIKKDKRELVTAQEKAGTAFFELKEVELEVSFVLDAKASAEGRLLVVKLGGETKAKQTHKVVIKLSPLPQLAPALLPTGPAYAIEVRMPEAPVPASATPTNPVVHSGTRKQGARRVP
jgi:hypothetical protein